MPAVRVRKSAAELEYLPPSQPVEEFVRRDDGGLPALGEHQL